MDCAVKEFGDQGYCSLTLLVSSQERPFKRQTPDHESTETHAQEITGQSRIVQIRPARYALDMLIARAAKETYPLLAPSIRSLESDLDPDVQRQICVYEMQRMQGTPLSRVLSRYQDSNSTFLREQENLIDSFATMIAQSLHRTLSNCRNRSVRADSPMDDNQPTLHQCTGKVGSTILSRLSKLVENLPEEHLNTIARDTMTCIKTLTDYPIVLNHGDLIPSNILINEETWAITGLVDWAEAEYLPFATCLYGLEHLLGYVDMSDDPTFEYYENASELRELFWSRLFDLVPSLKGREAELRTMRRLGILLWYGFAWDDGAIDRVVNDGDDPVEMACLRAFLEVG